MKKDEFARELMLEELKKERGNFITQRIVDRLVLLYSPLFDREFLQQVAETVNREARKGKVAAGAEAEGADKKVLDLRGLALETN